ncbi:Hypothetical protein CINCED_3A006375 [Cinara cedri]|uniref:Uncharacterized protein n=1 Tax=Cinara cedri TaxID=506608 RepID=A0A5E4MP81_9HEMI|nr:Hypothetical protein CINCED_3A006375 [Cinara cedri]
MSGSKNIAEHSYRLIMISTMFETCIISYFIFQHICKHLELQKMHQTSKILSMFTIDDISLINNSPLNSEFEKLYEESVKHITFKKCKNLKVVPTHKINNCLKTLKILLGSLSSQFQNCPFAVVLLSMLSELVMGTDIDKNTAEYLIDLITGYLDFCKLPSNFLAISYAFNIYQKLKPDPDLELLSKNLCRLLIKNMVLPKTDDEIHNKNLLKKPKLNQYLKDDLERVLNTQDCWIDKSIIGSYILIDLESTYIMEDEILNNLLWTLNENVVLSTQYTTTNPLLIFPYSVSLHFSIKMKNEDCLFNNLCILDNYLNIAYKMLNENNLQPVMNFEDYTNNNSQCFELNYFLEIILQNYEYISQCLPNDFLIKYWEFMFNPQKKMNGHSKKILSLCSPENLIKIIDILKTKTMELFEINEDVQFDYYSIICQLWSELLTIEFINKKKKIRKELVNHFCFIINRTFIFNSKKMERVNELILLIQLICSLLKLSWINKTMLMNFSFRIMNFFESIHEEKLLKEVAELLIVLYKCPNNSIKPLLGLYVNTFSNFFNQCWSVAIDETRPLLNSNSKNLYVPLHKLELCSSLFKQNKKDFEVICQYFIADLIKILATRKHPKEKFMRFFYKILFNLMDICSPEEMRQLMLNIQGPSLLFLKQVYQDYQLHIKFTGRL